jgi:hypothetical protein
MARELRLQHLFNNISKFPTLEKPIHYPKSYIQGIGGMGGNFHDLIYANLNAFVPNIDVGYHSGKSSKEIVQQIELCKSYMKILSNDFISKCNAQLDKVREAESKIITAENFDLSDVELLPDEVKSIVFQYLLPETKIDYFMAKYPDYKNELVDGLDSKKIRLFHKDVYSRYYSKTDIMSYDNKKKGFSKSIFSYDYTKKMFVPKFTKRLTRKSQFAGDINKLFKTFNSAVPNTAEENRFFKTRALDILMAMILFGKRKAVAAATKAPRKPRTKNLTA